MKILLLITIMFLQGCNRAENVQKFSGNCNSKLEATYTAYPLWWALEVKCRDYK